MATWKVNYLPEALKEMSRLDGSVRVQVKKAIDKVAQNPTSHFDGGHGEPLANRQRADLSGLYKIKLRSIGIRVVYALMEVDGVMLIVVVGARANNEVYEDAASRREKYDL